MWCIPYIWNVACYTRSVTGYVNFDINHKMIEIFQKNKRRLLILIHVHEGVKKNALFKNKTVKMDENYGLKEIKLVARIRFSK